MSKKMIVAGMLVFCMLFGCAFSYSAFSSSLISSGTINANSSFDVYFVKDKEKTKFKANDTITASNANVTVTVSGVSDYDKNSGEYDTLTLAIAVPYDFSSDCTFPVYVHNAGLADVVIDGTEISDNDNNNRVQLSCTPTNVASGKTEQLLVTIHKVNDFIAGATYSGIKLTLNYSQPTVATVPTAAHSSHS